MKIEVKKEKRRTLALKTVRGGIRVLIPDCLDENTPSVKKFIRDGLEKVSKKDFKISKVLSKNDLHSVIDKWKEKLKVEPNRIQIRDMKNKWSSCSTRGNITFNKKMMFLPKEVTEYAVVHELLHLAVPSHGRTFKSLLSTYLSNWEELHSELLSYSILLDNSLERKNDIFS